MSAESDERFAAFVDRESPELLRVAWYLTADAEAARDLVQDVLVRAYPRWSRLRRGEELGYLRRAMVNLQRDGWRRRARARALAWHRASGIGGGDVPAPDPATRAVERAALAQQLQQLPPRQREVVVLRHACDLSEQEVAAELGISVGTVKSAASRGIARLRELAGAEHEDDQHPDPGEDPDEDPDEDQDENHGEDPDEDPDKDHDEDHDERMEWAR